MCECFKQVWKCYILLGYRGWWGNSWGKEKYVEATAEFKVLPWVLYSIYVLLKAFSHVILDKLYPKVKFLWQRFILHFNFWDFVYLFFQNKEHWTLNLNFFCTFLGNEKFLLSFNPHFSVQIKWYICIKHTKIMNMLLATPSTIKLIIV